MHDNDEVFDGCFSSFCFLWLCNANTSITILQMVSIGIVMKQTIASARVRWKTKKWTFVRLCISYLPYIILLLIDTDLTMSSMWWEWLTMTNLEIFLYLGAAPLWLSSRNNQHGAVQQNSDCKWNWRVTNTLNSTIQCNARWNYGSTK